MRRTNGDLLVVILLSILAAATGAISGDSSNVLRAGLSLPFVLFLPGYALSAALLPDGRAGLAERIALSAGLSLAIAMIGGLLLNLLSSGLTAQSWRFLLLGVTLVAAGYAIWRRQHSGAPGPGPLVTRISLREAVLVSSAALLIGLTLGLGAIGVDPNGRSGGSRAAFTQMWAVPAPAGDQYVVNVGLQNYEAERTTYRVTLEAGGRLLAEWPRIVLANGASWQAQATLPPSLRSQVVTANAYRADETAPYRHVRLAPQGSNP